MEKAKMGDNVRVHYVGKLEDGTIFNTTMTREPITFTIGEGQVIPGFEQAVIGMEPGSPTTIHVPADEAFGPHRAEMVGMVHPDQLPEEIEPQVGQQLQIPRQDGPPFVVSVTDVSESAITFDANHPLAGHDLVFDIRLVEIL